MDSFINQFHILVQDAGFDVKREDVERIVLLALAARVRLLGESALSEGLPDLSAEIKQ